MSPEAHKVLDGVRDQVELCDLRFTVGALQTSDPVSELSYLGSGQG